MALAKSSPEAADLIPSREEILQHKDLHANIFELQRRDSIRKQTTVPPPPATPTTTRQAGQDEAATASGVSSWRSLVSSTQQDHVGPPYLQGGSSGSWLESVSAGDDIFVLPGARLPFVLRPRQPGW